MALADNYRPEDPGRHSGRPGETDGVKKTKAEQVGGGGQQKQQWVAQATMEKGKKPFT